MPADGKLDGSACNPIGNPGMQHWQAGYIEEPGLQDRANVFFAAVEITRMPMIVTDPRQPIFDHEGELLYFFSSQMNITERRASEQSSLAGGRRRRRRRRHDAGSGAARHRTLHE